MGMWARDPRGAPARPRPLVSRLPPDFAFTSPLLGHGAPTGFLRITDQPLTIFYVHVHPPGREVSGGGTWVCPLLCPESDDGLVRGGQG